MALNDYFEGDYHRAARIVLGLTDLHESDYHTYLDRARNALGLGIELQRQIEDSGLVETIQGTETVRLTREGRIQVKISNVQPHLELTQLIQCNVAKAPDDPSVLLILESVGRWFSRHYAWP